MDNLVIQTYLRYTERGCKYVGLQPTACNDRATSEVGTGNDVELTAVAQRIGQSCNYAG